MKIDKNFFRHIKPSTFERDQIHRYKKQLLKEGNVVVNNVFDEGEMDFIGDLLNTYSKENNVLRLQAPELYHRVFLELLAHPLIVELWSDVLGAFPICSHYDGNIIPPMSGEKIWWHIDHPCMLSEAFPPNVVGQTIIMLDDFTKENGATKIIRGSHEKGIDPKKQINVAQLDQKNEKTVIGKKGSISFTFGGTWHTAGKNTTNFPRRALVIMYVAPHTVRNMEMSTAIDHYGDLPDCVKRLLGASAWIPVPRNIHTKHGGKFADGLYRKIIANLPKKWLTRINNGVQTRLYLERRNQWGYTGKDLDES